MVILALLFYRNRNKTQNKTLAPSVRVVTSFSRHKDKCKLCKKKDVRKEKKRLRRWPGENQCKYEQLLM